MLIKDYLQGYPQRMRLYSKDDRKLLKFDDSKVKLCILTQIQFSNGLFNDLGAETNKFIVAGNCEYKETDSTNSVQSSLKSHPLWVTLHIQKITI